MSIRFDRHPAGMLRGVEGALRRRLPRRERERLQLALELSSAAMVLVDRLGLIVLTNGVAELLFGYSKEEMIGQAVEILLPPRFRTAHPGYRADFLREPGAKRAMGVGRDLWALRKDATEFPVEIGLSRMQGRECEFVAATIVDITERKRIEGVLRQSVADLEAFAYTVSHNLRSPIRAMQGYAHFIRKRIAESADPDSLAMLQRISDSAERLDRLIRDLLSFNAIAREALALAPIDLDKLIAEIVDLYPNLGQNRVRLRAPLGRVLAQESLMTQVLSNLLVNAAKFVPKGRTPVIEVWTEAGEGGKVRLCVQDNGAGIPREQWSRIFEPFERLPAEEACEGTGIGLAIVKMAVERLGGSVSVESEPGKGSLFSVMLRGA